MVDQFYCDECEAPCCPAYEGASEPAHVTDGDHYWCDECWRERADRIQAERDRAEDEDARAAEREVGGAPEVQ